MIANLKTKKNVGTWQHAEYWILEQTICARLIKCWLDFKHIEMKITMIRRQRGGDGQWQNVKAYTAVSISGKSQYFFYLWPFRKTTQCQQWECNIFFRIIVTSRRCVFFLLLCHLIIQRSSKIDFALCVVFFCVCLFRYTICCWYCYCCCCCC